MKDKNDILSSIAKDIIIRITDCLSKDDEFTEEYAFKSIIANLKFIFSRLGISDVITFSFENYNNSRIVILNGIRYNLTEKFCIDNCEEQEALTAIDSVISALNFDSSINTYSLILKHIEEKITDQQ